MSASGEERTVYAFEGYRLDPSRRQLTAPDGSPVPLRDKVLDTLLILVRNAGQPVAKRDLMRAVWSESVVEENNLNQAISALRQAFGDDRKSPRFIATIVGKGYQFVAPVVPESRVSDAPGAADEGSVRSGSRNLVFAAGLGTGLLVVLIVGFQIVTAPQPMVAVELESSRLVTQSAGTHTSPTLSPNGQQVAYVSSRSGMPQIWIQRVEGAGGARQLTEGDEPARSPSWAPDRALIVFERALPDGTPAAWLIDADGSQPPRLLMENAEQPKFATSGDTIVFSRGPGAIFSMPVDGTSVEALEGVPETAGFIDPEPAMNASGDIAFVLADEGPSGHLWLYRAGSGHFERLTRDSGSLSGRWVQAPAWHPDGHLIFFVAASGDGFDFHLWQANIETGETVQISSGVAGYGSPTLSGDGRHLAYSFSRPLWELVASDPDTGEEESLLRRREPIILPLVSPDGSRVVFFDEQVFSFSIEDDSLRQWTFGDARVALPIWSRSAQSIYYFRDRALHQIDPATAATERVLDDFHWSKANWLAVHGNRLAFRERTSLVGGRQTVVLDLENGQRRILDAALIPMDWTRDGATLLGVRGNDLVLMTCDAPRFDCMPIVHRGEPVAGARPRWTADERGIFLRRARQDLPGHAWIWRVDRDGGRLERKVQIGPYDPEAMTFGVTRDDRIVWNRYDSQAGSEIWTTTIPDSDAE